MVMMGRPSMGVTGWIALVSLASLAGFGCSAPPQAPAIVAATTSRPTLPRGIHHKRGSGMTAAVAASASPHLSYFGGRVVSNLQVVQVIYGDGSYLPQVTSTASPSMATFYQGVLNSAYVDWLTEYDTNVQPAPTSDQLIGRGSFATQVVITPSAANDGPTIDDTNIQAELAAQIQAGTIPAPTHDAAGNNNTYYAIFFPHGKVLTLQGITSCVYFCAYHGTIANVPGFGEVYYGVHPDFQAGSGCENGCGAAATAFGNYTQVASHEMTETITDAEVGIAPSFAAPLAWYDTVDNGEIGDLCNDEHATIVGGDGVTYDVQSEFSNTAGACIVTRPLTAMVTATPLAFEGGTPVVGTVTLDSPVPAGGVTVGLASDTPALVSVPAILLVPAGAVSATFAITSVQTAVETTVTLTATFPASTSTVSLTVRASPTVASVALSPSSVQGGTATTATVTLSGPAPSGGALVSLASSNAAAATVPASITVQAGATSASFTVTTTASAQTASATISASYHDSTQSAVLTVSAISAITQVLLTPYNVEGGGSAQVSAVFVLGVRAPASGATIVVSSSNPIVVAVPPTLSLAGNADGGGLVINPAAVTVPTLVTISGTYPAGFTASATLLVSPPGNAAFDSGLQVPRCTASGSFCDTGATLVLGRANISGGAEPNTPNTLGGTCADGTSGTFHSAESLDRLSITTVSGDPLAVGELVRVDAAAFAANNQDSLDLFFAPDATNPVWTLLSTIPSTVFSQEIVGSTQFTLPPAALPAIRANWRFGGTAGPCTSGAFDDRDDLVFALGSGTAANRPPVVNAGPDQTVGLFAAATLSGTATDDGLPNPPGKISTVWTVVSGPSVVTFANAASLTTTATFGTIGTYDLRLTASDGALTTADDVVVTVTSAPVNQPPVVSAGPDQTITLPAGASLNGTVTDDGLPNPPATVTVTWSLVSGPGTVTFANANAAATTATFSASGTYDLRLTASDTALSASDDLIVTVNAAPVNKAPVVNAGPDQTITLPAGASLAATVTDDGLPNPPGTVTVAWSKVSGPGTVTFASPSAKTTTASFSTSGTYDLRLTASDSALSASDDLIVTVKPAPTNQAPTVNAGPDLTITLPAAATLNGSASDDGLPNPPGAVTVTWSKVSGPGTVTFASPSAAKTTATFSTSGTYVVRLTASDSALSSSDTAQVTVNPAAGSNPCASLCSNPTNFTISGSYHSPNLGTGAVCYQTTSVMHGGNCGNFVSPRTLKVNGTTEPCTGGNWASVPATRNGGYCIQTTTGNQSFAYFTAF
jgi:hypothetical protein